jgi:hypothetical protein
MKYDPDPLGSSVEADAFVRPASGSERGRPRGKASVGVKGKPLYSKQDFI